MLFFRIIGIGVVCIFLLAFVIGILVEMANFTTHYIVSGGLMGFENIWAMLIGGAVVGYIMQRKHR